MPEVLTRPATHGGGSAPPPSKPAPRDDGPDRDDVIVERVLRAVGEALREGFKAIKDVRIEGRCVPAHREVDWDDPVDKAKYMDEVFARIETDREARKATANAARRGQPGEQP